MSFSASRFVTDGLLIFQQPVFHTSKTTGAKRSGHPEGETPADDYGGRLRWTITRLVIRNRRPLSSTGLASVSHTSKTTGARRPGYLR